MPTASVNHLSSRSSWSGSVVWIKMWKGLFCEALDDYQLRNSIEPLCIDPRFFRQTVIKVRILSVL